MLTGVVVSAKILVCFVWNLKFISISQLLSYKKNSPTYSVGLDVVVLVDYEKSYRIIYHIPDLISQVPPAFSIYSLCHHYLTKLAEKLNNQIIFIKKARIIYFS